jgi:MoxR-like ATPase
MIDKSELNEKILPMIREVITDVKKAVVGKDEIIVKMILAIIADGHILLEDIPGVGKTTLALAVSDALSLKFNRIQFTPDVMPSDVTGYNVYNRQTGTFDFFEGAVFANILLADELNRTSGKTQSALLEAMEEESVTVDGVTRDLPHPFTVIATQNPTGSVGTAMLPESQLDRFMIRLSLGYPARDDEVQILRQKAAAAKPRAGKVISADDVMYLRDVVRKMETDDKIYEYIADLAKATRESSNLLMGISPRGSLSLAALARSVAMLRGRTFVLPEDVRYIWEDTVTHRVILTHNAKISGITPTAAMRKILTDVPVPKL